MNELQNRILALKKEKNALILAHYYQTLEIHAIADHVCDSFEMARRAQAASEEVLVVAGVRFMAESAKILNPEKKVLLPAQDAGCPMADMLTAEDVQELRKKHPDAAVVGYVNSSAAVKAVCDVCCTSSSAVKIVRALPQRRIVFVPDRNLGAYVASQVPEKEVILYDGCCPVHDRVSETDVLAAKAAYPKAKVLVHPECRPEVMRHADYIGSTAGILAEAVALDAKEFIIGTEAEITERLKALVPGKAFYTLTCDFICADMKKTRLQDIVNALEKGELEITLQHAEIEAARRSLERMVELG